jgi:hypothetical protein
MNPLRAKAFLVALVVCILASLATLSLGVDSEKAKVSGDAAPQPPAAATGQPEAVSIVDLLARPEAYDGKFVRVEGFLHVHFEGTALFMTKEHADYLMCKYGFWVSLDEVKYPAKDFDGKYVLLEGTFNRANKGHMRLWSGELRDVSRVMELTRFYDGAKAVTKP